MTSIAIVGSGLSGLVVARALARHNDVTVFEKSRGVGGRMATRYAGDYEFDHGAQFFTARTRAFREFLAPYIDSGAVAVWEPIFAELRGNEVTATRQWDDSMPHYVASPRMNALAKTMARGLDVRLGVTIASIRQDSGGWLVRDAHAAEHGPFDWVILTAPAAQTARLAAAHPRLEDIAAGVEMLGCYALMLGFAEPPNLPWQAALVRDADISWLSVNSSKPGRPETSAIVAHSTNAWAQAHIDDDIDSVRAHLVDEAARVAGLECSAATHCGIQRWRFANIGRRRGPACFIDTDRRIGACGDWFIRGRVEAAFTSARALLEALRGSLL